MTYYQLKTLLADEIIEFSGTLPEDYELHLADSSHVNDHTLDWNVSQNYLKVSDKLVIKVKDAKRAIVLVGNAFFVNRQFGVHPTAIIEKGAVIGRNCIVGPHAVIKSCVKLGNDVIIEAGAVIGNEGFGFVKDASGNWIRFPQIGSVIIGDRVEVGANSTIDRGALSDTVIGRDVKINACVHIAHNVHVGAHTIITANVNVSGSSVIGDDVWIGPGSILRDHIEIGNSAYVGMGSNVVKNVPANEVWCGNPARKLKDR